MEENTKKLKKGFFRKLWYSIFKLEKYGEMSAEGVGRAIIYLVKLSFIIALVISIGSIYKINGFVEKGKDFLNNEVGDFTYQNGILEVKKEEPIRVPSSMVGEIIIDTKIETNEEINQYLNSLQENKGIIILKDRILAKGISTNGILSYKYDSVLNQEDVNNLDKEQLLDYLNGSEMWKIYGLVFVILLGYSLLNTFLPVLFNVFILSIFGYIVTWFARIKMRYAAVFNLAAYSLTLSILLHASYIIINIFTQFNMKYFQIMYIGVAAIYLIASILLIKSEFIKKQVEIAKMVELKKDEENEKEDKEKEGKKEEDKDKNQNEDNKKDGKDNKDKKEGKDTNVGEEPEGA